MQRIMKHSVMDEEQANSYQHFYSAAKCKNNEIKSVPLMLVAQESFFFQCLKTLLSFYQTNPSWQFKIVAEAQTQPEALKLAMQQQPSVILLDMDCQRKLEETINTIIELSYLLNKRNQEQAKLLAISSQRDERVIFMTMQAGAVGYILKDNLPSQLYPAMQTVLNGQVYLCSEVATQFFRGFHLYRQARTAEDEASHSSATSSDCGRPYRLTQREQEVLDLLVKGYSNEEIAKRLYITIATVKAHLTAIFEKLGVKNRSKAIVRALELGIV